MAAKSICIQTTSSLENLQTWRTDWIGEEQGKTFVGVLLGQISDRSLTITHATISDGPFGKGPSVHMIAPSIEDIRTQVQIASAGCIEEGLGSVH